MPRNREEPGISEGPVRDGPRADDLFDALRYATSTVRQAEAANRVTTIRPAQAAQAAQAEIRGLRLDRAVFDDLEVWQGSGTAGAATSTVSTGAGTSLTIDAIRNAVRELDRPLAATAMDLWTAYSERFRRLMGPGIDAAAQEWQYDPTFPRTRSTSEGRDGRREPWLRPLEPFNTQIEEDYTGILARAAYDRDRARRQVEARRYRVALRLNPRMGVREAWEEVAANVNAGLRSVLLRPLPYEPDERFANAYLRAQRERLPVSFATSHTFIYEGITIEVLFPPPLIPEPAYPRGHQFDLFPAELAEAAKHAPKKTQEDEDVG